MPRKEPRNYAKEYREYHGKPSQVANRSARNKAVRKLDREGKAKADGKEVDHVKGSRGGSPLSNAKTNLRVVKKSTNRRKG